MYPTVCGFDANFFHHGKSVAATVVAEKTRDSATAVMQRPRFAMIERIRARGLGDCNRACALQSVSWRAIGDAASSNERKLPSGASTTCPIVRAPPVRM